MNKKHEIIKSRMSGTRWYQNEAAIATNQAIGRVIRHRHDTGLIYLIDARFEAENQLKLRPKWLQDSMQCHKSFSNVVCEIKTFLSLNEKLIESTRTTRKIKTNNQIKDKPVQVIKKRSTGIMDIFKRHNSISKLNTLV